MEFNELLNFKEIKGAARFELATFPIQSGRDDQ
jgi:hypothetical protein